MNKIKKYLCYTSKNNLEYLSKFKIENLKKVDDRLSFYVDKENYEMLSKNIELEAIEIRYSKLLYLFKKQLITILGILLIILALINQSKSVVDVRFTNSDTYNEDIVKYLEKFYKHVGPFTYLKEDLSSINTDLRKTFYHYEWIGVRKNGAYLYLDIREIKNTNYEDDPRVGSYYAKSDGIVKRYHVEKGIVLVQEEQYVAKGDVLISGEIPHHGGEIQKIKAKGYVIAEVLEYREFYIPIENLSLIRTGKLIKTSDIYIFGRKIGKNRNTFEEFEKVEEDGFNFLNFIKTNKVYYYEVKNVKTILTEEDAINYTKSLVINDFRLNKVNPFEKIIFNELVKIEVNEKEYYIKLIVKTYQNIAKFIPDEIRQ